MPQLKEWSQKELDFLRRNYVTLGARECAEKLGRPVQGVRAKAWRMGFKGKAVGIQWTPQMEKMVKDFYPIMFSRPLARWIGVSRSSLIRKARELGIEKEEGFLDKRRDEISRMAGSRKPNSGQFKKGSKAGERYRFKPGYVASPEVKKKQSESMKKYWARRKKYESLGLDWRR